MAILQLDKSDPAMGVGGGKQTYYKNSHLFLKR